ncbi:MAG TPA: hypothetical protein PLP33_13025, partial [Leptospiraceae bacterium]|nr:hypothetical protein [Leptospiraceae bacterium]HNE10504.1 hypothetical protein [Leptospiraceae bacterium]
MTKITYKKPCLKLDLYSRVKKRFASIWSRKPVIAGISHFKACSLLIILLSFQKIAADNLVERPIENRNLYLPFIFFLEPYPATPVTLKKGSLSIDSGMALSNMIDNNNAQTDYAGYTK